MSERSEVILREVWAERKRQEGLCLSGKFSMTCAEEFGEVAKEACELYDPRPKADEAAGEKRLRAELVQLAAVAMAWIESIGADNWEGGEG